MKQAMDGGKFIRYSTGHHHWNIDSMVRKGQLKLVTIYHIIYTNAYKRPKNC